MTRGDGEETWQAPRVSAPGPGRGVLCPGQQRPLSACVKAHPTSPGPGAKKCTVHMPARLMPPFLGSEGFQPSIHIRARPHQSRAPSTDDQEGFGHCCNCSPCLASVWQIRAQEPHDRPGLLMRKEDSAQPRPDLLTSRCGFGADLACPRLNSPGGGDTERSFLEKIQSRHCLLPPSTRRAMPGSHSLWLRLSSSSLLATISQHGPWF